MREANMREYAITEQADVHDFAKAHDLPAPEFPTSLGTNWRLRADLILEEAKEFEEAAGRHDFLEMIDALCDILYVTYGAAVEMGVDLNPFWFEVHGANMEKIGGPKRADGKLLKPPGWKPPDHADVWTDVYGSHPIPKEAP